MISIMAYTHVHIHDVIDATIKSSTAVGVGSMVIIKRMF
jgi:hypothetical protein